MTYTRLQKKLYTFFYGRVLKMYSEQNPQKVRGAADQSSATIKPEF